VTAGSVTLAPGDSVTCTITNTGSAAPQPVPAQLTLVKVVDNALGGAAVAADWTLSAAGPTPLSGPGGASGPVTAGTYALSESAGPAGYTASLWSCPTKTVTAGSVTLAAGDSVTCTITNTGAAPAPVPAQLTLVTGSAAPAEEPVDEPPVVVPEEAPEEAPVVPQIPVLPGEDGSAPPMGSTGEDVPAIQRDAASPLLALTGAETVPLGLSALIFLAVGTFLTATGRRRVRNQ